MKLQRTELSPKDSTSLWCTAGTASSSHSCPASSCCHGICSASGSFAVLRVAHWLTEKAKEIPHLFGLLKGRPVTQRALKWDRLLLLLTETLEAWTFVYIYINIYFKNTFNSASHSYSFSEIKEMKPGCPLCYPVCTVLSLRTGCS